MLYYQDVLSSAPICAGLKRELGQNGDMAACIYPVPEHGARRNSTLNTALIKQEILPKRDIATISNLTHTTKRWAYFFSFSCDIIGIFCDIFSVLLSV